MTRDGKNQVFHLTSHGHEAAVPPEDGAQELMRFLGASAAPPYATHAWPALFAAIEKVHDPTQDAFAARLFSACAELLGHVGHQGQLDALAAPTGIDALLRALETPEARTALRESDAFAPARIRWLKDQQRILRTEGGTLCTEELATALGISQEGVRQRASRGTLLALPIGSNLFYPVWQFRDTRAFTTLPGLRAVLSALGDVDPWGKALFLLGTEPALAGERPLDFLRRDEVAPVIAVTRQYGEQGAR